MANILVFIIVLLTIQTVFPIILQKRTGESSPLRLHTEYGNYIAQIFLEEGDYKYEPKQPILTKIPGAKVKKANSVYQRRKFNAIKRNMKNGMDAKKAEETEMKKLSERNKRWREKNKDKVKFYAERIKAKKR